MPFRTQHRIVLGFIAEIVIPSYDDKTIDEFPDGIDDVGGFEVVRLPSVDDLQSNLPSSYHPSPLATHVVKRRQPDL